MAARQASSGGPEQRRDARGDAGPNFISRTFNYQSEDEHCDVVTPRPLFCFPTWTKGLRHPGLIEGEGRSQWAAKRRVEDNLD
ncbi:hypothetical protein E2C01_042128 [Portunus trituberculatus]|uniref:Uncharacterized protein n=1 Tax=Portunus trituberculatus TaxID=210409 RepID=A0A5B7FTR4_PORTR|nr:hypothetical protein [Portunus trituberculatus]